jgi:hypothetical protein
MIVAVGSSHPPRSLVTKRPSAIATRELTSPTTASTVWNAAWRRPK